MDAFFSEFINRILDFGWKKAVLGIIILLLFVISIVINQEATAIESSLSLKMQRMYDLRSIIAEYKRAVAAKPATSAEQKIDVLEVVTTVAGSLGMNTKLNELRPLADGSGYEVKMENIRLDEIVLFLNEIAKKGVVVSGAELRVMSGKTRLMTLLCRMGSK